MAKGGVFLTKQEIKKMKPKDLKVHLTARSMDIQGNRKQLQARLMECMEHMSRIVIRMSDDELILERIKY